MKKVLLSILLTLLPNLASADPVEINGIWYNLFPKGKAAEVTSNPNKYSGDIVIPDKIEYDEVEYTVTTISSSSFYDCLQLSSIKIPKTIQKIGDCVAFSFENYFPVISIFIEDLEAWCNIDYLYSDYPGFERYNLYLNGSKLVNIEIPNTIDKIKTKAFYGCVSIKTVEIHDNVTSIDDKAFGQCISLNSVNIGNDVINIGESAFSGCAELSSVNIGNSVSSIGNYAFVGCNNLSSLTIPNSLTSIGKSAFMNCSSLNSVHISDLNAWCGITFTNDDSNPLSAAHHLYLNGEEIKNLVIPNSVTSIGSSAFYGCTELTSVTIPNCVTSISSSAFFGCSSLSSIIISNSVTSIGNKAFAGCIGLTSFTIPNSVNSIGESAFHGCSSLTSLTIGANVRSISSYAFAFCSQLTDVYCLAEKLRVDHWYGDGLYTDNDAFYYSYIEYASLHVPATSIEAYRSTAPWSQIMAIVALEDEDNPEIEKCATPEISYADGKLTFTCETEGAECVATISDTDIKTHYGNEITLSQKYTVTVYATKAGYENSDVATREIVIENGQSSLFGDLNKDGKVNVADHVKLSNIILNQE